MFLSYIGTPRKSIILPRLNNTYCCRTIINCLASRNPSTNRPRFSNHDTLDYDFNRNRVSNGKTVPVPTQRSNSRLYHDLFDKRWGWLEPSERSARRGHDQVPTSLHNSSHKTTGTQGTPHGIESNPELEDGKQTGRPARSKLPQPKQSSNLAQQTSTAPASQSKRRKAQRPTPSLSTASSKSAGAGFLNQAVSPSREDMPWASQPSSYNESLADPSVVLSSEQDQVVEQIMKGRNVFYTGSAGCGKSAVLRAFRKRLEEAGRHVIVIAPTGLAALNVGGVTLHRYAGWRPQSNEDSLDSLVSKTVGLEGEKHVAKRFRETDVLVIDEISMVENNSFERLDVVMRCARGRDEPFGGVQVVVTGDFCQLPPVSPFQNCFQCGKKLTPDTKWDPSRYQCTNTKCEETEFLDTDKWAFRSTAWEECDFEHIHLTEVHRQIDPEFKSILQTIRLNGTATGQVAKILRNHHSETDGAVELFSQRVDVAAVNQREIDLLPTPAKSYACLDNFHLEPHHRKDEYLLSLKHQDPLIVGRTSIRNKVGAQTDIRVLLLHNLAPEVGLVNGSQGKIIGFERYDREVVLAKGSIHGSYGLNQVIEFAEGPMNMFQDWSIVMFDNGEWRTIYADCMATEHGFEKPKSLLSRTQIPLVAGYAMTVHKAQGMTLDRVKADLRRAFVPGMVYVALSRARSLLGLECQLPTRPLGGPNREVRKFLDSFYQQPY